MTVGIFTIDPVTGQPNTLLTSATVQPTLNVGGMYGANGLFAFLNPGEQYYAGVNVAGAAIPLAPNSGVTSFYYYLNPQVGWIGPGPGIWSIRVYCGSQSGSFVNYGSGKVGVRGVPVLRGLGFPNTTNPITLQVSSGPPGGAGVLVLGARRTAITVPPLGTLLVDPMVTVPITLQSGTDDGSYSLNFTVPNQPSWRGATITSQAFLLDATALGGVSHTDGLEATFDH